MLCHRIMSVIAAASRFGWVLIRSGMSVQIAQALLAFSTIDLVILLLGVTK